MFASMTESSWPARGLAVLRIVAGFLFLCHGVQKALGLFGGLGGHAAAMGSMLWAAGWIETLGGILIMLGAFTRPVAFVLCGTMAAAYFIGHAPKALLPLQNGGEPAVLFCFVFLYLCLAGGGAWSVDSLRGRN